MHAQGATLNTRWGEEELKESRRYSRFSCSEGTRFIIRKQLHEGTIKNFSQGEIGRASCRERV